ncbi:MAG TPA: hypothetical protein DGT21_25650 [Armatimonadetes bacterium]|nr:hypothetical protein [Armatimonadota bacterium]
MSEHDKQDVSGEAVEKEDPQGALMDRRDFARISAKAAVFSLFATLGLSEVTEQVLLEMAERHGFVERGSSIARSIRSHWRAAQAGDVDCRGEPGQAQVYYCRPSQGAGYACARPNHSFECISAYAVCTGPAKHIFDCDDFKCKQDYTCDASFDFLCTLAFACADTSGTFVCHSGHVFFCNDHHHCTHWFTCNSDGDPNCSDPPSKGYNTPPPGDFECEGSAAFDCQVTFRCTPNSRFQCSDHFDCQQDFYCYKPQGEGFDCKKSASFSCTSPAPYHKKL